MKGSILCEKRGRADEAVLLKRQGADIEGQGADIEGQGAAPS